MVLLDGKLLYALQVYPADSFNLCPADACEIDGGEGSQARFFLKEHIDAGILDAILNLFISLGTDFGSIEYLEGEDGVNYFYAIPQKSPCRLLHVVGAV